MGAMGLGAVSVRSRKDGGWFVEGPGFQPEKEGGFCQCSWLRTPEASRGTKVTWPPNLWVRVRSGEACGRSRWADQGDPLGRLAASCISGLQCLSLASLLWGAMESHPASPSLPWSPSTGLWELCPGPPIRRPDRGRWEHGARMGLWAGPRDKRWCCAQALRWA